MASQLEKGRDVISGGLVVGIGIAFLYFGSGLRVGTASRMGPGYFPMALSLIMICLGLAIVVNSLRAPNGDGGSLSVPWGTLGLIIGSVVFFALTLKGLGLFVSMALCILASASASRYAKWRASAALAVLLSVGCVAVFVWGLGLSMPIIGPWLTPSYWLSAATPRA